MFKNLRWTLLALSAMSPSVLVAENLRHLAVESNVQSVRTLQQNWSDEESNWFYNAAQGSRLLPYRWFLELEQADSSNRFREEEHIRELGFLARTPSADNPDGLPIGFVKDAPYEDGTKSLGLTCAACHTRQVSYKGVAYLIDGGPALGDLELLLKRLTAAMAATAQDDAKFERFASAVLPNGSDTDQKNSLRAVLRTMTKERAGYDERNLSTTERERFGPGRVDAFGAIFNEVSSVLLGIPENVRPANAPVSYPCLWDTPQHDRVQWNGAAENRTSPIGEVLFGSKEVGALGRNAGEVLGVFGHAEVNDFELLLPRHYESTVNKSNLLQLENSLKKLWSPKWPAEFGEIDPDLESNGEAIYQRNCAACHPSIGDRTSPDRKVTAIIGNEGTDDTMLRNFGRSGKTGKLNGRKKALLASERFTEEAPVGVILRHVVERVILAPTLTPSAIRGALAGGIGDATGLNPGYQMTATIEVGDKKLVGTLDDVVIGPNSIKISGGSFHVIDRTRDVLREGLGRDVVDLTSAAGLEAARSQVEGLVVKQPEAAGGDEQAEIANASVTFGYKARPLNGVWATAPYLHNGSVPSLSELLKPADKRIKQFHVGSLEFDTENVGFKEDPSKVLFDTTISGNSNAGHEHGSHLSDVERRQLLEYLKSL